jgi:ABC-type transport system involved in multi-copper enzyme maturation permease subunit
MTATTATAADPRSLRPVAQRVTQIRVMKSEWTKLRSLRSTVFSLLAAVIFIVGFGVLVSSLIVGNWPPKNAADIASFDPTSTSLAGSFLAQLAIGVLGVLFMTGEYATGMIRATFAAVPRRLPVLWGKAAVFSAAVLALTVPSTLIAFTLGQSILSSKDIQTSLGEPGVLRAVIGAAFYLTLVGLLGLAIGTLLRSTAAGISTLLGVIFVLPIIVGFLPSSWSDPISKYLPSHAGQSITNVRPDPSSLGPWAGFAVFCLYVVIVLGAAAVSLRRRDA